MAEIVNLRRERKRKQREEREVQADENRRLHGRTLSEKSETLNERLRKVRNLDGHRLDKS
ncbi:DUF4169 family protein [Notoacmeibacter ruber]|uniref:DUF4169 family protein n=1 Tax=Notoacmeibacter ruber TaxID=2670375 RepID=A0A3L7JBX8_9HYPH|nr:DUF4169 family protein [Notoacmeibacter ruber]RLQ88153.1 DUF4169 family protein [Notoacmeibacter ruber]